MIKKLYPLILCLLIAFTVTAQDGPIMKLELTDHDFGKIKEEAGSVSYSYPFINKGNRPLKVDKVVPGCGCTIPDWSKDEIKPGKEGFIKATFDPTGRIGPFNKYITVYSNSTPNIIILTFKGEVLARTMNIEDSFPVLAGNLRFVLNSINYGALKNNIKDTVQDLVVYNTGNRPITIKSLKGKDFVMVNAPLVIPVKKQFRIPIHYNPSLVQDYGLSFEQVRLVTDDDKDPDKLFSVIADIHQYVPRMTEEEHSRSTRLDFEKKQFDFGDVKQGDIQKTTFKFRNSGKQELTIYKVKSSCGCTAADPKKTELKPGESSEVDVTFYTAGKHGKETKEITVYSNDPMNPETILKITANILTPKN